MNFLYRRKHNMDTWFDYLILLLILSGSLLLLRAFGLHNQTILAITVPLSLGYVMWGVYTHKKQKFIDRKILAEYLGLAVLVNVIIGILVL